MEEEVPGNGGWAKDGEAEEPARVAGESAAGRKSSIVCSVQPFFASQTLHNRNFFKKKSGDVHDEVNFSLFILLHKRAKPFTPPYIHP